MVAESRRHRSSITFAQPVGVEGLISRVSLAIPDRGARLGAVASIMHTEGAIVTLFNHGGILTRSGIVLVPDLSLLSPSVVSHFGSRLNIDGFLDIRTLKMKEFGFFPGLDMTPGSICEVIAPDLDKRIRYRIAGYGSFRPGVARGRESYFFTMMVFFKV